MEITWRVISGKESGENGEKVQGIRSINGRQGEVKSVQEMEKPKSLYV